MTEREIKKVAADVRKFMLTNPDIVAHFNEIYDCAARDAASRGLKMYCGREQAHKEYMRRRITCTKYHGVQTIKVMIDWNGRFMAREILNSKYHFTCIGTDMDSTTIMRDMYQSK